MQEELEEILRNGLEVAAEIYQMRSGHPLTDLERAAVEHLIEQTVSTESSRSEYRYGVFTMLGGLCCGFSIFEQIGCTLNAMIRQLHNMGVKLEDVVGPLPATKPLTKIVRWLDSNNMWAEFYKKLESDAEMVFFEGCFLSFIQRYAEAKKSFDEALTGSLPRRMQLVALQERALCCVHLDEWDEAMSTCDELKRLARTPDMEELATQYKGYVRALFDFGIKPPGKCAFPLPEAELMEPEYVEAQSDESAVVAKAMEIVAAAEEKHELQDMFTTILWREVKPHFEQMAEFINQLSGTIQRMAPSYESIAEELRREQGEWIDRLANKGALVNGEFLFRSLARRSFGDVIVAYCNAVEAEVQQKIIKPLERFLKEKTGKTELSLGEEVVQEPHKAALRCAEHVLRTADSDPLITRFMNSYYDPRDLKYMQRELPDLLQQLRTKIRRKAAHGAIIQRSEDAEKARALALMILKRLSEIHVR